MYRVQQSLYVEVVWTPPSPPFCSLWQLRTEIYTYGYRSQSKASAHVGEKKYQ